MRTLLAIILVGTFYMTPLSAQDFQGTMKEIQDSGKIKIGYRQSLPPMSFLNKDGIPSGYSVDLCNSIAEEVKDKIGKDVDIEYVPVTSEDRFEALTSKKIDILCGSTTITLARRELVDFTNLTFVTGGAYLVFRKHKIKDNFDGKKIGVEKYTRTAEALAKLFDEPESKVEIVLLNSKEEGLSALKKGEIDMLSADQVVLIGLALKEENPGEFRLLSDIFSYDPIALAVRRNDADFRLIADRTLSDLYETEQIKTIYKKWFSEFYPSMPESLQALIKFNTTPAE